MVLFALETAQAVTPFFNVFLLFDVSGHWGGEGWGCACVSADVTRLDLAHMFDATQEHRRREMSTLFVICARSESTELGWFSTHFLARALARVWPTNASLLILLANACWNAMLFHISSKTKVEVPA